MRTTIARAATVALAASLLLAVAAATARTTGAARRAAETPVQTAPATKSLASLTWLISPYPPSSIDPVKFNDYPEDIIIRTCASPWCVRCPACGRCPASPSRGRRRTPDARVLAPPRRHVLGRQAHDRDRRRLQPRAQSGPEEPVDLRHVLRQRQVDRGDELPHRHDPLQDARCGAPPRARDAGRRGRRTRLRQARRSEVRHAGRRSHVHRPVQAEVLERHVAARNGPQ